MASAFRPGATALITGGASGIGFAFAQLCRSHGMHLALVDINHSYLAKAKDLLGAPNNDQRTEIYQMDVSQISEWQTLRSDVEAKSGTVDLLMLNAGASFKPQQGKSSWEDVEYFQKVSPSSPSHLQTNSQTTPDLCNQRLRPPERPLNLSPRPSKEQLFQPLLNYNHRL